MNQYIDIEIGNTVIAIQRGNTARRLLSVSNIHEIFLLLYFFYYLVLQVITNIHKIIERLILAVRLKEFRPY